jgi:hypothetical protein
MSPFDRCSKDLTFIGVDSDGLQTDAIRGGSFNGRMQSVPMIAVTYDQAVRGIPSPSKRVRDHVCPWDEQTRTCRGRQYLHTHTNRCPWDETVCWSAATPGDLHASGCLWAAEMCLETAISGGSLVDQWSTTGGPLVDQW